MLNGKELAEAVIRHVQAYPEQHDQSIWVQDENESARCGTTACLAGWAVILNAQEGESPMQAAARLGPGDFASTALTLLFPGEDVEGYLYGPAHCPSPVLQVHRAFYTSDRAWAIEMFAGAFGLDLEDYR